MRQMGPPSVERAREGVLGGEDNLVFDADDSLRLNKGAEAAEEAGFDQEGFSGPGGAENFRGFEFGELGDGFREGNSRIQGQKKVAEMKAGAVREEAWVKSRVSEHLMAARPSNPQRRLD
jgi:hypothetical protein